MASPRVFVSSTYYDLKYIRASLEIFIESLGFDPILSEKGDIAYSSDRPLDESCYREVENSDIFVLIIGGRYGAENSQSAKGNPKGNKTFFERYESITKTEYANASRNEIPVYVLIEKSVYAEYQTFLRNRDAKDINYAHVDSVNIFFLIDEILAQPRNNPVQSFEKFEDIEAWLREQWAGHFRELLKRQSQQQQLKGLSQQVAELKETNETLKTYLEAVMRDLGPTERTALIEREEKRLSELRKLEELRKNRWVTWVCKVFSVELEIVAQALRQSSSFEDLTLNVQTALSDADSVSRLRRMFRHAEVRKDVNEARGILDLPAFNMPAELLDEEEANMREHEPHRIQPFEGNRLTETLKNSERQRLAALRQPRAHAPEEGEEIRESDSHNFFAGN